jgi:hypothetical protein
MVKTKQPEKITSITKGDFKDLRVRKETAKKLQMLKLDLDLLTYDDVLQYMLNERLLK